MTWLWIVLAILVILLIGWWIMSGRSRPGEAGAGAAATGIADIDRPEVDVPDVAGPDVDLPDVAAPDVDADRPSFDAGTLGTPDAEAAAAPSDAGTIGAPDVSAPSAAAAFADVSATETSGVDLAAGEAALGRRLATDDLELVEGIGPAIKDLLDDAGVRTWEDLAGASTADLRSILESGGPQYNVHDPATWPEQARLALRNEWDRLGQLQERLRGGLR